LRVRNLEIDCAIGSMRVGDPRLDSIRLHREDYRFVGTYRTPRVAGTESDLLMTGFLEQSLSTRGAPCCSQRHTPHVQDYSSLLA